jgi:hypothetical protein
MHTHANRTSKNKNQFISSTDTQMSSGGESTFQFVNNRPEVAQMKRIQEFANNSPRNQQPTQFQNGSRQNVAQQVEPIQKKENNTGLPDNLKSGIENLSGHSMNDVKVHYNSGKPAQLNAHAYAQGTDIHLASGQEKHLPHEAWHVVQQKQGRVKPTLQMKNNVLVNDDQGLEKEADQMGQKAIQMAPNYSKNIKQERFQPWSINSITPPVQRLAIQHGLGAPGAYAAKVGWSVLAHATLIIGGAAPVSSSATSGAAGHAEDQLIAWAQALFGIGGPLAGTEFEIWISSSPCSSGFGTSALPPGCMERLQAFALTGVNVIVHADKPYQPRGPGMKAASVAAAGALAGGGIPIDFSKRTGIAGGLTGYPNLATCGVGHAAQPAHGTVAQLESTGISIPTNKEADRNLEKVSRQKEDQVRKLGSVKLIYGA